MLTSLEIEKHLSPLCKKFSLPSGFFEIFTGIKERRVWEKETLPSHMSTLAAQKALTKENLKNTDIDYLLHVSVSRDYLEPATAATVHNELGLSPQASYFDISNACLGFLNGILVLSNMIELGHIKRGLIVGTEISTPMIEAIITKLLNTPNLTISEAYTYLPSLTLGCGSAALILAHTSVSKTKHRILGGLSRTASEFHTLCQAIPDTGLFNFSPQLSMKTEANTLMQEAAKLAKSTWTEFKQDFSLENNSIHHIFSHQVGRMPREEMMKALGVDHTKDYPTFEFLGNMGSVSLPATFAMGVEKRQIQAKDNIILMGFGSGINSLFFLVQW